MYEFNIQKKNEFCSLSWGDAHKHTHTHFNSSFTFLFAAKHHSYVLFDSSHLKMMSYCKLVPLFECVSLFSNFHWESLNELTLLLITCDSGKQKMKMYTQKNSFLFYANAVYFCLQGKSEPNIRLFNLKNTYCGLFCCTSDYKLQTLHFVIDHCSTCRWENLSKVHFFSSFTEIERKSIPFRFRLGFQLTAKCEYWFFSSIKWSKCMTSIENLFSPTESVHANTTE